MSVITIHMSKDAVVVNEELRACRGCLKTECKLITLSDPIAKAYKDFTGTQIPPSDIYPKYICCMCLELLRKFNTFRKRCLKAKISMMRLATADCLTMENINILNKTAITNFLGKSKIEIEAYNPEDDLYFLVTQTNGYNMGQSQIRTPLNPVIVHTTTHPQSFQTTPIQKATQTAPIQNNYIGINPPVYILNPLFDNIIKDPVMNDNVGSHNNQEIIKITRFANHETNELIVGEMIDDESIESNVNVRQNGLVSNLPNPQSLQDDPADDKKSDEEMALLNAAVQKENLLNNSKSTAATSANATKSVRDTYNTVADMKYLDDQEVTIDKNIPSYDEQINFLVDEIKEETDIIIKEENLIHPIEDEDDLIDSATSDKNLTEPTMLNKNLVFDLCSSSSSSSSDSSDSSDGSSSSSDSEEETETNDKENYLTSGRLKVNEIEQAAINEDLTKQDNGDEKARTEPNNGKILPKPNGKERNTIKCPEGEETETSDTDTTNIIKFSQIETVAVNEVDLTAQNDDGNNQRCIKEIGKENVKNKSNKETIEELTKNVRDKPNKVESKISDTTDVAQVPQIETIMVNEVDLTAQNDDDDENTQHSHQKIGQVNVAEKSDNKNNKIIKKNIRDKHNRVETKTSDTTEDAQLPQIEMIIVNEIDLTAHNDDDDDDDDENTQRNHQEKSNNKNTKNAQNIPKRIVTKTPHNTEDAQFPQIETIIVNEVDLTAQNDDEEGVIDQDNVKDKSKNANNKELTTNIQDTPNTDNMSVSKNAHVNESDSESDGCDLPDCLAGFNSDIYQKDVKTNFSQPKPKPKITKFCDDDEKGKKTVKRRSMTNKDGYKTKLRKKNARDN